ncbi:MAG TPA: hypothetical protein VK131_13405 [Candidatus Acidoferrales bacterium]|nr:hypothetical protein [Candidatus Acidoferrales bacterium]
MRPAVLAAALVLLACGGAPVTGGRTPTAGALPAGFSGDRVARIQAEIDWLRATSGFLSLVLTDTSDSAKDGLNRYVQFLGGQPGPLFAEASIRKGNGPNLSDADTIAALGKLGFSTPDAGHPNYWNAQITAPSHDVAVMVETIFIQVFKASPAYQLDVRRGT